MADSRVAGPQLSRRVKPCYLNSYTVIKLLFCTLVFAGSISGDGTEAESSGTRVKRMVQTNVRGLHVCRSQGSYICCPGWKPNPGSGLCLTPVCRGSCGDGACSSPNTCTRCQQTPYGTTSCQRTAPAYASSSYPVHSYTQPQYAALNGRSPSSSVAAPRYVQGYQGYQTRPVYGTSTVRSCSTMGCRYSCGSTSNGGISCTCPPGYMLASDRLNCMDIDECSRYSTLCQQRCRNTLGGYQCACTTGQLQSNRRTCSGGSGCSSCGGGMPAPGPVASHSAPPGGTTCPAGFQQQRTPQGVRCVDIDECHNSQCAQDCINTEGGMRCECGAGFTLSPDNQGCIDIDECARSDWQPCHHTCINAKGSYRCACQPGFYLHQNGRSCLDVNECNQGGGQVCHHSCRNTHGSYKCACRPGFELQSDGTTCRDIDECGQSSNGCTGTCVNTIGSYQCSCTQGFTSRGGRCFDVNECHMNNGGCEQVCLNTEGSFLCSCQQGYTLNRDSRTCTDVNECSQYGQQVCEHGCENIDGTYQCICPAGFRLHANKQNCVDINECVEQQGVCHYRCMNTRGSYHCICPPQFELAADGRMCDDLNECSSSNHGCQGGCENTMGSYHCTCAEGQQGTGDLYCDNQPSGCTSETCSHKCVDTGTGHQCMCSRGYRLHSGGRHCEDINECQEVGKGGCQHHCINTMGSYYCSCYAGYRLNYDRKQCIPSGGCNQCNSCPPGFRMNTQIGRCEDVDECVVSPNNCGTTRCSQSRPVCEHNCINTIGSYSCTCRSGFLIQPDGFTCSQDGPSCTPPCRNGGTCRYSRQCGGNTHNCRFTECTCPSGFSGPRCENGLPSACSPPCINGGNCVNGNCQCTAGFTGPSCSADKNECLTHQCAHHCQNTYGSFQCLCRGGYTVNADGESCNEIGCFPPCMNGATCVNKVCQCPEGFSGANCQTDKNECALNNGDCEYICRNTYGSYVCFCPRGATLNPDGRSCSGVTCNPPCNNNGTCVNRRCVCPEGFTGPTCLQDINECKQNNPCSYQCLNRYGSYECVCPDGTMLGDDQRTCEGLLDCDPQCLNGGTCKSGTCICPEGFTGETCIIDIDECENATRCGFQCNNYYGGFECLCPPGFMLAIDDRRCVDKNECPLANCEYDCENIPGSYQCLCPEGKRLAPDRRSCLDLPCIPPCQFGVCQGGDCECTIGYTGVDCSLAKRCDQPCANGGTCTRGVCRCTVDFSGEFCQTQVCRPSCQNLGICSEGACLCPETHTGYYCQYKACKRDCLNNGTCGNDGICYCEDGFLGDYCQIKVCRPACVSGVCDNGICICNRGYRGDDCNERECRIPCQNGGTCMNGTCACPVGYIGAYCERRDCEQPCLNGGVCNFGNCRCAPNYEGEYCQYEVCSPRCVNGGTCQDGVCICPKGFSGDLCETRVCLQLCQNNGVCVDGICQCLYGFIGPYCEIQFGGCEDVNCFNGGYCSEGRCVCLEGFTGPQCTIQTLIQDCIPDCLNGGTCMNSKCYCTQNYYGSFCQYNYLMPLVQPISIYQTGGKNVEGTTVYYVCETNSSKVDGSPYWYYPSPTNMYERVELAENAQGRFSQQLIYPNTSLLIGRNLQLEDIGNYRCSVTNGPRLTLSLIVYPSSCIPICINGGECHGNVCMCANGYTGSFCETKLSYCPIRCLNGGLCDYGSCVCQPGYVGSFCQIAIGDEYIVRLSIPRDQRPTLGTTISIICEVFETSNDGSPAFSDTPLVAEWELPDPVRPPFLPGSPLDGMIVPSQGGSVDVRQILPSASLLTITNFQPAYTGSYNCSTGSRTISYFLSVECLPLCMNGGACVNGRCQCFPGFSGDVCEIPPPEMINKNCRYGCANDGTCNNGTCLCPTGLYGDYCEIDSRELTNDPCKCLNGGTCAQGTCICPNGYSGDQCQIEDGVCNPPCQNGGTCLDGQCYCDIGYVGFFCEIKACQLPCEFGDCITGVCVCDDGYTGTQCNLLECKLDCLNGGECINGTCECQAGFTGEQCDLIACILPCVHGRCVEGECQCFTAFEGEQCDKRRCILECLNGGQCEEGVCVCPTGFDGPSCQNTVPYIEIIQEQLDIRYGIQLSWRCIYHFGNGPFWRNPNQRYIQQSFSSNRGDLGFNNVYSEIVSDEETRLVIVDFQPRDAGNYSCGTNTDIETIVIEASPISTTPTTTPTTTPAVNVTISPEPPRNCVTFNSSFCQGLPYQEAVFPTAFAPESEAADLLASAIHSRLTECGEAAKVVLCYHFFQPCIGTSERLCAEICQDVKLNCNSYMEELLTFFSPAQAQQFLSACNDLPSEEANPSCIKSIKKQPDRISKCDNMCENGGTCIDDQCICLPEFTGEMCDYPVDTQFEYDVVITPNPFGYPDINSNLTVICEIKNNNVLVFPTWFGLDSQNIPAKQSGNSNQRVYMDVHSTTASKLVILDLRPEDQGTYRCIVGQQSVPHTVILHFPDCYSRPCVNGGFCVNGKCKCPSGLTGLQCEKGNEGYIVNIYPDIIDFPLVGFNLTFRCELSGLYPSSPIWLDPVSMQVKPHSPGINDRVFIQEVSPTETALKIFNVQPQDSGTYVCVVGKQFNFINITVQIPECLGPCLNGGYCIFGECQCPPDFEGDQCQSLVPPSFSLVITPAPGQSPVIGGTLTFLCEMTQSSEVSIPFWMTPDGYIVTSQDAESSDGVHVEILDNTAIRLVINNLNERDEGVYKCVAGPVEAAINVTVFEVECERPCLYGSACVNGTCLCPYGLQGDFCQIQVPGTECSLLCANDGLCINQQCFCQEGYLGELCQIFVGDTFNITVVTIDDQVPSFGRNVRIVCEVEGDGVFPSPMWISPRQFTIPSLAEGGSDHINVDTPHSWTTVLNINDISSDDEGIYTCVVGQHTNTYIFVVGVSDCESPCANGGRCVEGLCRCPDRYRGRFCEVYLPVTDCEIPCANDGRCVEGLCRCPDRYSGRFCEVYLPVPDCELPCQNEATCVNGVCHCRTGFTDKYCNIKVGSGYFLYITSNLNQPPTFNQELIVTCRYVGSQKKGRPWWSDPGNQHIRNSQVGNNQVYIQNVNPTTTRFVIKNIQASDLGRYTCHVGDIFNTYRLVVIEPECNPACQNGGICDVEGCNCTEDYTGVFCQTPVILKCNGSCWNDGICYAGSCLCIPGFTGNNCEIPVPEECAIPCDNYGRCVNDQCVCQPGFKGDHCQERDDCILPCENGGTCLSGICICPGNYTGDYCDTRVDDDMVITIVRDTYKQPSTGDDVRVSCEFVGSDTTPQPFWTKPDGYQIDFIIPGLIGTRHISSVADTSTATSLVINDIQISDEGTYTCFVGPLTNTYTILLNDFNCDPFCVNGGFCTFGKCQCTAGYTGVACEIPVSTGNCRPQCENQGICNDGFCVCGLENTGAYCQITIGDGFFITINNQPYEEFRTGQDVTVTCEFVGEGGQAAQPAWRDPDGVVIRPSGAVSSDRHISTREVSPLVTELTIHNIQPMDSGVYTCHVGSSTNTLTVDLQDCIYPCENGGFCVDGLCNCLDGFTGQYCDTPVVECVVPCENNGRCVDGVCMCTDGFDGNLCEISIGDGMIITIIKDSLGPHQSGEDVVVTCDYSSTVRDEQPAWIDPQGISVQPNSQGRLRSIAVSPSSTQLSISNIQPTDSGIYTCYVGTRSNTFTLTINYFELP